MVANKNMEYGTNWIVKSESARNILHKGLDMDSIPMGGQKEVYKTVDAMYGLGFDQGIDTIYRPNDNSSRHLLLK